MAPVHRSTAAASTLAILLPAVAVFVVALVCHPRLVPGGEYDQYVQVAEALLRGEWRTNDYHPRLHPELTAVAGWVCGDAFTGGKLVGALCFAAVAALLVGFGRRRWPTGAAARLPLLLATLPMVWLQAMQVASDLLGTTLVVAAWYWATAETGRWRLAGLAAGLAVATRWNLAVHGLALAVLVVGRGGGWRGLWTFGGFALLGTLPNALPNLLLQGAPWANRNWHNIVLKYQYGYDLAALRQQDDAVLAAQLQAHWPEWLAQGLGEFAGWLWQGLPELLLGPAVGATLVGRVALWGALVAGGVAAYRGGRRGALLLAAVALGHAAVVTVVFYPLERVLLPTVLLLGVAMILGAPGRWLPAALVAVGLAAGQLADAGRAVGTFVAGHFEVEVAAARDLVAARGELLQIAGSYPFLDRELRCASVGFVPSFGRRTEVGPAEFWSRLQAPETRHASVFVLGRESGWLLYQLAASLPLPDGWQRLRADADVVVLERRSLALPQLRVPDAVWRSGPLPLHVTVPDPAPRAWVGVVLHGPDGAELRVSCEAAGEAFRHELPAGALPAGAWRLVPTVLFADGRIEQGAAVALQVGG